jgi:ribosomal protein S18 acetylase RimI-like enzyme
VGEAATVGPAPPGEGLLDNAVWAALQGRHARFARGAGGALGYRADVSPFHAVDALDAAGWASLAELVAPGGAAVLFRREVGPLPGGWRELWRDRAHQLVLDDLVAVDPPAAHRELGDADVGEMLALVELAQPGPFLPRTIELGRYLGVFEDGRLVAMAGERLDLDGYTEVSAVCTHPDARRRGLAAALTAEVCRGILARGDRPFLHVAEANDTARRVYEALGFRRRAMVDVLVARAPGSSPTAGA